jgi:hypothetical protein
MSSDWVDSTKEKNNDFKSLNEDKEADACVLVQGLLDCNVHII